MIEEEGLAGSARYASAALSSASIEETLINCSGWTGFADNGDCACAANVASPLRGLAVILIATAANCRVHADYTPDMTAMTINNTEHRSGGWACGLALLLLLGVPMRGAIGEGVQFSIESWPEDEETTGVPPLDSPRGAAQRIRSSISPRIDYRPVLSRRFGPRLDDGHQDWL